MFLAPKRLSDSAGARVRFLVRKDQESVIGKLARKSGIDGELRTVDGDLSAALAEAAGAEPCILVVQVLADSDDDAAAVQGFVERNPYCPVIAVGAGLSTSHVRRMMRAGVVDALPLPLSEDDFSESLAEATERFAKIPMETREGGRVIALMKASGGVGSTTIAVQAAHAFLGRGRSKRKVCLIDFDLQFGNVGLYLDIEGERNIGDFLRAPEEIDPTLFNAVSVHHGSGIDVIVGPQTLWPVDAMDVHQAQKVVEVAARMYDYVVIDLPDYWTEWTRAVLEKCDGLALVMQMTVAAVRHTRRRIDLLRSEGLGGLPLFVIANRYEKPRLFSGGRLKRDEVERALGHQIDFVVPSLFKVVNEAQNRGIPIAEAEGGGKLAKIFGTITAGMAERLD
ncbi:MAG TPA: AAA family ATPase [Woeseiaceae bacterium]|nr:AAA family ATPase [Woeseiaceae bacterium]